MIRQRANIGSVYFRPRILKDRKEDMKNGKLYAILIGVAFAIAVIFSFVFFFSVKEVNAEYSVYSEEDTASVQQTLDSFKGKSILFVSESDVVSALAGYTRFKVVSVNKSLPNVINVQIEERREVYHLPIDGVTYCMDKTGFVLGETAEPAGRDIIDVYFEGIDVLSVTPGGILSTSEDGFFLSVLEMAEYAGLSDCIESVTFRDDRSVEIREAVFKTYTGVEIVVDKPDVRGHDKIVKAFEVYNATSDFYKTFSRILVLETDSGEITATWTAGG